MYSRKSSVVSPLRREASRKSPERQSGQTLIELMVVIAVSVIVIGALVFATIASLRNAQFSKNQAQATKLAQEGIERVRVGRDRNQCITSLDINVKSWNGDSSNTNCPGPGSIWTYSITGTNSNCENPTVLSKCYFSVDSGGSLTVKGYSQTSFPQNAEGIPTATPVFKRAITLSDDSTTFASQKTVTSIVIWNDFSGQHESRLTTILRNQTL